MKYSRANVGRMQLDEYVRIVPQIYGRHDQHRSIWDVWCHTLHHGAAVAERIRKEAPADKLFIEIADLALWLFTAVQKLSGKPGKRKSRSETPTETLVRITEQLLRSDLASLSPGLPLVLCAQKSQQDSRCRARSSVRLF
jgi:hypothetical protein